MTKLGMKRTTKRTPLKAKIPKDYLLDSLWSKVVRGLSGNRCVLCGETKGMIHAHHWVGRRYKATRWVISNGISVCHNCHQKIHDLPQFRQDIISQGDVDIERLEHWALQGIGIKQDKEKIKAQLKARLEKLGGIRSEKEN